MSYRKQRVKVNETFSCWKNIEYGVPQGSILGPLLFNIHLCDLFYFLEDLDIASYADDTKIYKAKENKESVINALEASSLPVFTWFFFLFFFLSGVSFTDTDDSQDNRGRERTIFYSTLPLPPAHEHSDIYLQLCM